MGIDDEEKEIWDTRSFKQLKRHLQSSTCDKTRVSELERQGQGGRSTCRDINSGVPFKRKKKSSGTNSKRKIAPRQESLKAKCESSGVVKEDNLRKPKAKPKTNYTKCCGTREKLSGKGTKCDIVGEETSGENETSSGNLRNEGSECGGCTPVKDEVCQSRSAGETGLEYCPKCQMPFRGLNGQSPQWHVVECLNARQTPIGKYNMGLINKG